VSKRERILLAAKILAAFVAGGIAGAGVHLQWYGPVVGVGVALLCGLAAGVALWRAVGVRRARRESGR